MTIYRRIDASRIHSDTRWDVPPENQGQIIVVAYAEPYRSSDCCTHGATYRRVTDRSVGPEAHEYYQRVEVAS